MTGGPTPVALPAWPESAVKFVRFEQERIYRRLGEEFGLGSDPTKAFAYLSRGEMPASNIDPENFRADLVDQFGSDDWEKVVSGAAHIRTYLFQLEPPTEFEDVNLYRSMWLTLSLAYELLDRRGVKLDSIPLLATLPSGDVNARTVLKRGSPLPIIFFEQGLFQFLYDSTLFFGWCMPLENWRQLAISSSLPNPLPNEPARYIYNSVCSYVIRGSPATNPLKLARPSVSSIVLGALIQEMELFVMAHELAHLAKGHLHQPAQDVKTAWLQEYEADEVALSLLCTDARDAGRSWEFSAWACDIALGLINLLSSSVATMAYGQPALRWISPTHPAPLRRQQNLRNKMLRLGIPGLSWQGALTLGGLQDLTQQLLNALWALFLPNLLDQYAKGVRPCSVWKERTTADFAQIN